MALVCSGFVVNTISSLVLGKVNKTGKAWRLLQLAHGILNKVDPEGNAK